MNRFQKILLRIAGLGKLDEELGCLRRAAESNNLASALLIKRAALADAKLAALRDEAGVTPASIDTWTPDELAALRTFHRSPLGVKYVAQLREMAAQTHAKAVSCAHGTAERRVGYSHGFEQATFVLSNLCALLDRAPAEQTDDDAPSGDADRS